MNIPEQKVAIVTGGATGIGKAIVKELVRSGLRVVIVYNSHGAEARKLCNELRKSDYAVDIQKCDVTQQRQVRRLINEIKSKFESIDVLINNAGITRDKTIGKMQTWEWQKVLKVNLDGAFYLTKAVFPVMKHNYSGHIINISSVIGQMGAFGQANYAASKAGLIGFTKSCALEFARYNITVNAVCPGYVETQILSKVPEDIKKNFLKKIPLARFGTPGEIATTVRFLATEATYITGQCINMNGGLFLG